ncbi:unnamed protein product [Amoebophrya sp. A25]|nr:unnamed protein product [Amoebophrya sp. A25]|eukprot:GSA25T00013706001.1
MIPAERRDAERPDAEAVVKGGDDDEFPRPETATTDAGSRPPTQGNEECGGSTGSNSRPGSSEIVNVYQLISNSPPLGMTTLDIVQEETGVDLTKDEDAGQHGDDNIDPEYENAAVKIQAVFRGKQARQGLAASSQDQDDASVPRTRDDLLKELEALEKEAENKHSIALGIGERGALSDLGPNRPGSSEQRSGAKARASSTAGEEASRNEIRELETSIATLKDRLKERNMQKRDLLSELMEARKLVWEYKQEATKAKQGIRALLSSSDKTCEELGIDIEIPDSDAPPGAAENGGNGGGRSMDMMDHSPMGRPPAGRRSMGGTLSPRGLGGGPSPSVGGNRKGSLGGGGGAMTKSKSTSELANVAVQHYIQLQDAELKKSISKLTEARMVAHAYMKMIEDRTEIIHRLESELEKGRMKQAISTHPCGEVFLSERMEAIRARQAAAEAEGGGPGGLRKSGPLSMPPLRETAEEQQSDSPNSGASSPSKRGPPGPGGPPSGAPQHLPVGLIGASAGAFADGSASASSSAPPQQEQHGSGGAKYTFQQLSILTSVLEGVLLQRVFRELKNHGAEEQAAVKLQSHRRRLKSQRTVEGIRKYTPLQGAVGTIVRNLDKWSTCVYQNSFTIAVGQDPERCLRNVVRHLKGYVGVHFATELLQTQMKVHLARKDLVALKYPKPLFYTGTTSTSSSNSTMRTRPGGPVGAHGRPSSVPILDLKDQTAAMASVPAATQTNPPTGYSYTLTSDHQNLKGATGTATEVRTIQSRPPGFCAPNTVQFFKEGHARIGRQDPDRVRRPGSQPGKPPKLMGKYGEAVAMAEAAMQRDRMWQTHGGVPRSRERTNPLMNRTTGSRPLNPRSGNQPLPSDVLNQLIQPEAPSEASCELFPLTSTSLSASGLPGGGKNVNNYPGLEVNSALEEEGEMNRMQHVHHVHQHPGNYVPGALTQNQQLTAIDQHLGARMSRQVVQGPRGGGGSRGGSTRMRTSASTSNLMQPQRSRSKESNGSSGSGGSADGPAHKHMHHHYHVFLPPDASKLPRPAANASPEVTRMPKLGTVAGNRYGFSAQIQ